MQKNLLHIHDLRNPAGALTISRLLIAIAFPFLTHEPTVALSAYLAAIATDIADGAIARRRGQTSHTGAVLDGWVDKILHINGAWSMTLHGYMPAWWLWLWFSREVIQWAMFLTIVGDFANGSVRVQTTSLWGRATATLLFAAFVTTLCGMVQAAWALTIATGFVGTVSGLHYLKRHLDDRGRFD
ncbi:MAG: CDP-alcohol phosphatidyltransferase family protein [Myxococcota bacterium]|nr:CDP-alcohol phosphatidyltransferase family protein [Myxococcota bacterium]